MNLDSLDRRLLDEFQRNFPLSERPYVEMAIRLGTTETDVRKRLAALIKQGMISRIGAVFRPHAVGYSTLAALEVPAERLEEVAALVNAHTEVTHNYQREHRYNLWFVVTADDAEAVSAVLSKIQASSQCSLLDLPLVEAFHIDLGFPLWN